jgi:hypothetical protein
VFALEVHCISCRQLCIVDDVHADSNKVHWVITKEFCAQCSGMVCNAWRFMGIGGTDLENNMSLFNCRGNCLSQELSCNFY